jgi:hypothetical protein
MKRTLFLSSAAIGAATIAASSAALAQPATPPLEAAHQGHSNEAIREAYGAVAESIDELNLEQADYGGHRVAAIADLQAAKAELLEALKIRHSLDRAQQRSDAYLGADTNYLTRVVGNLSTNIDTDYAGHRVAAIAAINKAITELDAARTHP